MKTNKIKLIFICICIIGILLFLPTKVKAVLQSNGGTEAKKTIAQWIEQIRQMEQTGGALGLQETLNTDLTPSSSSNNLDCHMEKNTEYGAMAILSASSYGKPDKINDGETTTGNKSGIYIKINNERVAAGDVDYLPRISGQKANTKYMDNHSNASYNKKNGDAIAETKGWHGSTNSTWFRESGDYLLRSCSGSLFSYNGYHNSVDQAYYLVPWASRAVIVVGQGL